MQGQGFLWNTPKTQAPAQPSIFGNPTTTTTAGTIGAGGGLFGGLGTSQPTGGNTSFGPGSLFGGNQTATTAGTSQGQGGVFGSFGTQQQQGAPQINVVAPLFGGGNNQTATAGTSQGQSQGGLFGGFRTTQPTATAAPAAPLFGAGSSGSGFTFGNQTATAGTSQGQGIFGGFGTQQATTQPTAPAAAPLFGAAAASGLNSFFGNQQATTPAPSQGIFGGFGTQGQGTAQTQPNVTTPAPAAPLFGAGSSGSALNTSFGGLGTAATTATPSFFGAATSTPVSRPQQQQAPLFGSLGAPTQSQSGSGTGFAFGQQASSGTTFNLGAQPQPQPSVNTGFVFGTPAQQPGTIQAPQHQQPFINPNFNPQTMAGASAPGLMKETSAQMDLRHQAAIHQSVFTCYAFGDERDITLSNLNFLQACVGAGKGYFSPNFPPVSITPQNNSMYRFVGLVYSHLIRETNHDGHVLLHINKPIAQVIEGANQLISTLHSLIGTQEVFFTVKGVKAVDETTTAITIHLDDKTNLRRISAMELASTLLQPNIQPLLGQLGIKNVLPKVRPPQHQIDEYLDVPPPGVSMQMWRQAIEQNPDPQNMIPTVILGPEALKARSVAQRDHMNGQLEVLKRIQADITSLHNTHSNYNAVIQDIRKRHALLSHRIVLAALKRLMIQTRDIPFEPAEAKLIKAVEELKKDLSENGKTSIRMANLLAKSFRLLQESNKEEARGVANYTLDPETLEQIKSCLKLQQAGIKHLLDSVKLGMSQVRAMSQSIHEVREANEESRRGVILESLRQ